MNIIVIEWYHIDRIMSRNTTPGYDI